MFLIRLMHINSSKIKKEIDVENYTSKSNEKNDILPELKNETINQIKNVTQEKKLKKKFQKILKPIIKLQ